MLNECVRSVNSRLKEEPKMVKPHLKVKKSEVNRKRCCWNLQTNGYAVVHKLLPCRHLSLLVLVISLMAASPLGAAQNNDEPSIIRPTPALRLSSADELTTVLLVNNDGMGRLGDSHGHGRYLSVRPEVGLLTSTARTFIQEGITTEYATQVVGTTLDNGRLYAQYLKKSSRVLYENGHAAQPSVVTSWVGDSSRSFLQSHNDLFNADASNWRDIDDSLDNIASVPDAGEFVGNTDFFKLKELSQSLPVDMTIVAASTIQVYKKSSDFQSLAILGNTQDTVQKLEAQKVFYMGNLPTFTVKNHFEPSGHHTIEKADGAANLFKKDIDGEEGRSAKVYYKHLMLEQRSEQPTEPQILNFPKRVLSTVTYYGFANFTTIVGDSVIVFSPSSVHDSSILGHVTSIMGMATLRTTNVQAPVSTSADNKDFIESITNDSKTADVIESTSINNVNVLASFSSSQSNPENNNFISETATPTLETINKMSTTQYFQVNKNKSMLSLPTDQEIQEIFASLSKAQTNESINNNNQSTDSHIHGHIGATTIFTDDDPFANFIEPTRVINNDVVSKVESTAITHIDKAVLSSEDSANKTNKKILSENGILVSVSKLQVLELTQLSPIVQEMTSMYNSSCDHEFPTQMTTLQDVQETTKYNCIQASQVKESMELEKLSITTNTPEFDSEPKSISDLGSESKLQTAQYDDITTLGTLVEATTEETTSEATTKIESSTDNDADNDYVTESESNQENDNENEDYENELDEVDLIYKTLYTTYTYLTTFFQGKSSTVSSHTEILTNVITSEVGSSEQQEDLKTAETISRLAGDNEKLATETFSVTKTAIATLTTSKYIIPDELDSILYSSANDAFKEMKHSQDTTYLDDTKYTKTFFTTYTYYTTIFADSETEIMSRTEVFTNYITGLDTTTETAEIGVPNDVLISSTFPIVDQTTSILFMANTTSNVGKEEKENITLVTDVRSSSSSGDQQLIGQLRDPVDDQVSSESNTEEILPSATLLLQTSFTTFTFYTTMYMADITNVVSRLETVTNIATETVQPIKLLSQDESTLPITYFTTFTYWTKLAKDGEITTISREETISNVIEPTKSAESETLYASNSISDSDVESYLSVKSDTLETTLIQTISANPLIPHSESDTDTGTNLSAITTYYTTYTYYTTSYEANNTVTDSRLETITNIITPTIAVEPTPSLNLENIAQLPSTASTSSSDSNRSDLILFDYKHIIDADRVSTLYFTTKIQSSINEDGNVVELTSSTSSLYIDESKKLNLGLSTESIGTQNSDSLRQYKTGLVRLIEGTRIGNSTTTLYQSKVIGTIIDNRYAQIIESTSSFLFEKSALLTTISPSVSQGDAIVGFTQSLDLESKTVVEGTMNSESTTEIIYEEHDDTIDDENNNNNNARTPFQTKKHSFAPVIRPFASRNRPTFAPKQKIQSPSSATIITRSDITPTITATPALKSVGRFGSSRRGSFSNAPNNPHESNSTSSLTSRRQFGRPSKTSSGLISPLGTSISSVQANNGVPSRNRFASTFRTSQTPNSRRPSLSPSYRPSSSNNFRVSALNGVSSRQRIKPTSVSGPTFAKASADRNIELENSTEDYQTETTDEEENATENIKRNQNPLLRFRRPLSRPIGFTAAPRGNASPGASTSPRRNPFAGRAKVTSTTTTTTTTTTGRPRPRSFQRPTISSLQTRPRPQNNLFPPRGLFQIQQQKDSEQLIVDNSDLNQNESESENDSEYDDEDDDTEGDGTDDDAQLQKNRRRRSNKNVQAQSPVNSRVRRQADTLNRSRFRLRRPKTAATEESKIINIDEVNETTPSTPRAKVNSRFGSRFQSQSTSHSQQSSSTQASTSGNRSIRPTRPTSPRTQFTLREKDTTAKSITRLGGTSTSNFRRQQSNIRQRTSSSPNSRRLKSYNSNHNHNTADTHGLRTMGTSRSRNSNVNGSTRGRGSMRGRIRNEYNQDSTLTDLGSATITVTHIIPAEVTVPVVNGQVTEYRNIVTGKTSLEILGPNQYTKVLGNNGQTSLLLTREDTSISPAGVTEITRYFLHDSTTTTVTFTPTTIRGRKTSFSHVLPSTVYSVENVVSTAQPQISANAPLANILLSQLLLGNINLPANQLLGALGQPQGSNVGSAVEPSLPPPIPQPLTEYRTHTSTYVTTIYDGKSTILPITFQGKKILTTVFDTTAQTITATEYSVDTIINTPTQQPQQQQLPGGAQVAQVNSLLLQQLLLQQQQQQIQQVSHTAVPQIFLSENLQELDGQLDIDLDVRDNIDDIIVSDIEPNQGHSMKNGRKKSRKPGKSHKRSKLQKQEEESSVITLYVSGRRPGEFSTILSTVHNSLDHSSTLHKRQAQPIQQTAALYSPKDLYEFAGSEQLHFYLPFDNQEEQQLRKSSNKLVLSECQGHNCELKDQTASLESFIGDVDLWYAKATKLTNISSLKSTALTKSLNVTQHFLA